MKHLKLAALALLTALAVTACDDEETTTPTIDPPAATASGAFVLNQGNQYDGIVGSMDYLDYGSGHYTGGFFQAANGQALGDGPQDGLVYGSKLYVVLYGSKLVWVCNAADGTALKSIPMTDPEGLCAADGKVYVSCNDGYVACIDTLTLEAADRRVEVGPNPVGMAATGGYVYVAVSDGYNSAAGYANGFKVAKLRTSDFTKAADITVGMNPTALAADREGNVFVVCTGNYGMLSPEVKPAVWKITPDDRASEFAPGTQIAVAGTTLYAVYNYTNYTTYLPEPVTYKAYNTLTGGVVNANLLPEEAPLQPIAIDVDPRNGDIFVTSGDGTAQSYARPGYVYRYGYDGAFKARYQAGVQPCAVFFK